MAEPVSSGQLQSRETMLVLAYFMSGDCQHDAYHD